jgi:hypothetical protein
MYMNNSFCGYAIHIFQFVAYIIVMAFKSLIVNMSKGKKVLKLNMYTILHIMYLITAREVNSEIYFPKG